MSGFRVGPKKTLSINAFKVSQIKCMSFLLLNMINISVMFLPCLFFIYFFLSLLSFSQCLVSYRMTYLPAWIISAQLMKLTFSYKIFKALPRNASQARHFFHHLRHQRSAGPNMLYIRPECKLLLLFATLGQLSSS